MPNHFKAFESLTQLIKPENTYASKTKDIMKAQFNNVVDDVLDELSQEEKTFGADSSDFEKVRDYIGTIRERIASL